MLSSGSLTTLNITQKYQNLSRHWILDYKANNPRECNKKEKQESTNPRWYPKRNEEMVATST